MLVLDLVEDVNEQKTIPHLSHSLVVELNMAIRSKER